jgi:hypothetical protein
MFETIIFLFSSRLPRSRHLFRALIKLVDNLYKIKGKALEFDAVRFENSSWIPHQKVKRANQNKSIELVVVSTSKDFDIIYHSVNYALQALGEYRSGGVRIVVPSRDVEECQNIFQSISDRVSVIDENSLVSREKLSLLTQTFGKRDTWVLQQLLKVQAVLISHCDAVLILDSDTLLLRKRNWFDVEGKQILMPTTEFNPPYYKFLSQLKICPVIPEYTFISHHMIMQPKILRGILEAAELAEIDNLINFCRINADLSVQSPICIEYELYAQSIFNTKSETYFISQWSNATIPKKYARVILNSPVLRYFLSKTFNSISFHSWS